MRTNEYMREYWRQRRKILSQNPEFIEKERKRALNKYYKYRDKYNIKTNEYNKLHRAEKRIYEKEWRKNNLAKLNAKNAKRRAAKLNQTPKWANLKDIEEFYINCPKGYHVDHIIPLKGKNVRGLHILENLQYLPASENIKKGNK